MKINKLKLFTLLIGLICFSWIGFNIYGYFLSNHNPDLKILGITPDSYYSGDINCLIKGSDNYKVSDISISLDGKLVVPKCIINKKSFEKSFPIVTKTLNDGNHELSIEATNGTYGKAKISKKIKFNVDNTPLQAAFVKDDSDNKVWQGRTLHIQFQANKPLNTVTVSTDSKKYDCFPESKSSLVYECFIPIDCEQVPNEYLLTIDLTDKVGNSLTLKSKYQIVSFPFKKQHIKIAKSKIKEANKAELGEKDLEADIERLTLNSPKKKLWTGTFVKPTNIQQITTEFGVIRTTQERGLRQHKALDIYNTPKSVIWAPQDGIVVLKNSYAHSGNTVVIDHGCGLLTLLFHLEDFADIEVNEEIKKGHPVGTLGKTGYATGYHLHWEQRLSNIAIDPLEWTKSSF